MKADKHDTADDRSIAENGCAVIESMLESALALQEQVRAMAIWRIDFLLPQREEPGEEQATAEQEKASDSIVDNSVNIGPVNVYSISESLNDAFSDFMGQTFSVASEYSQYNIPDSASVPATAVIGDAGSLKKSLSKDIRERHETVNEPATRRMSEANTPDSIKAIEESIEAASTVIEGMRSSSMMAESFQEAIKSNVSSSLDVLSAGHIDRQTIDVPAISPRRKTLAVTSGSTDSTSIDRSSEKEATVERGSYVRSDTMDNDYSSVLSSVYDALAEYSGISFATNVIEPMLTAGGLHVSSSMDVSELNLLSSTGMPRADVFGRQPSAHEGMSPLSILIEAGMASAGPGLSQAVYDTYNHSQAFNAITGAGISMAEEAAALPGGGVIYSSTSLASIYRSMENARTPASAPASRMESQKVAGASFHNTFNITVNMKGREEEAEMRELGKKIGLILTEELKRYGGS